MKSRGASLARLSLHLPFLQPLLLPLLLLLLAARTAGAGNGDIWPLERPEGMPAIQSLEVMCGKDHMDVHLSFTHPFEGIVSSKGQYADPRCVYVQPSTGKTAFQFRIAYARCGTKPDLHGQFYENTVVVQYDKDLLEVWDEAKRLRCEWFNDYEKTASKPPMVIADLDVIQLDFRGDNVDCWMEIQHGKGPWAPPVSGIVPLGSTLTLVVAINDYRGEFDMRVKSCAASDGGGHVIQLSDEHGCVLRPKMISRFLKARAADERASVITYAFFHAFKFPDALSVHIKCKVEICRHGCLDHCQLGGLPSHGGGGGGGAHHVYGGPLERKDQGSSGSGPGTGGGGNVGAANQHDDMLIYDELSTDVAGAESVGGEGGNAPAHFPVVVSSDDRAPASAQAHTQQRRPAQQQPSAHYGHQDFELHKDPLSRPFQDTLRPGHRDGQERFPHGPRHLDSDDVPLVVGAGGAANVKGAAAPAAGTSSPSAPASAAAGTPATAPSPSSSPAAGSRNRRRRSVVVSDRKVRSADVGVSGLYEVISEVDLAFTPERAEAVTVFQGRIREEVVYGICLPVPGFSVLFVLVAVSAVVSALVAGSLLYRYQLQRDTLAAAQQQAAAAAAAVAAAAAAAQQQRHGRAASAAVGSSSAAASHSSFAGWMAMRLLRARAPSAAASAPATSAGAAAPSTSSAAVAASQQSAAAAQGMCSAAQAQNAAVAAAAALASGNHCAAER